MAIDRAGNSFAKARRLAANNFNFRDALNRSDRADFFSFVLDQPSNINLRLSLQRASRQPANADLALFNGDRQILKQSHQRSTRTEVIEQTLDPGTYFLRVQRRSGDLRYRLSGSTTIVPTSTIQFSQTVYQITEGETRPFILTRTGSTATAAQVEISVVSSLTTFRNFPLRVTFNPGETTQVIPISIVQDLQQQDIETAIFQLTSLSADAIANSRTTLQILDDDRPFNIEFDYRFDTIGWFTPEKKAALEAAASFWEKAIQEDFPSASAGLAVPYIFDPQTNTRIDNFSIDRQVDDLVVFVGARDLGGPLGVATQIGDFRGDGYPAFQDGYLGADFEPWFGTVTFDRSTNFFVDATPETRNDIPFVPLSQLNSFNSNQSDFIDTAIHELGHVLGIGGFANAFFNQLDTSTFFIGENALRETNGTGIPITANLAHIENGFAVPASGKPSMAPFGQFGQRFLPTVLDLAILDDIGYQIDYNAASINSFPSRNRSIGQNNLTSVYARCACASCLTSS